ncbi:MAG: DUF4157 domain-containing protein [Oscillospiraceae bacterium]
MSQTYTRRSHSEELAQPSRSVSQAQGMSNSAMQSGSTPSASAMGRSVSMPASLRQRMENSFGADFSGVKFFESQQVADNGADAVTLGGGNVGFAPGKLDFSSKQGQELIGHELAHVVSHARGEVTGSGFLGNASLEAQADRQGEMAAAGQSVYSGPVTPLSASTVASAEGPMQAKKKKDEPKNVQAAKFDKRFSEIDAMEKSPERTQAKIDTLVDSFNTQNGLEMKARAIEDAGGSRESTRGLMDDSYALNDSFANVISGMDDDEADEFFMGQKFGMLNQMEGIYNEAFRKHSVSGKSQEEAHRLAMDSAMSSDAYADYENYQQMLKIVPMSLKTNRLGDYLTGLNEQLSTAKRQRDAGEDVDPALMEKLKRHERMDVLSNKFNIDSYKKLYEGDEAKQAEIDKASDDRSDAFASTDGLGNRAARRNAKNAKAASSAARMAELNLNDFSNDPELAGKKLLGATTSDVAAMKMLENVTPEMMKDPVFMAQMGRFLGGNLANFLSKNMSADNSKVQNMLAFRGNETALANAGQFMRMGMPDSVIRGMAKNGEWDDAHNGPLDALQRVNEYMLTAESAGTAELMRTAAQGMNGQDFNDSERSSAMMNMLMLRGVVPKLNQRAMLKHDPEGIAFGGKLMQMVNSPESSSDPEFLNQFNMQMMNEVGAQPNAINTSAMDVKNKSPNSPKKEAPKKKWYQFWK